MPTAMKMKHGRKFSSGRAVVRAALGSGISTTPSNHREYTHSKTKATAKRRAKNKQARATRQAQRRQAKGKK